ncbi:MAG: hypothetical protein IK017_02530 [Paludibacteraceae bacterium]|nr:hypothetical protein [Paludibacteraceae bacterium]
MKQMTISINDIGLDESKLKKIKKIDDFSIYLKEYNISLLEDTPLYRYIDLSRLIDLFYNKKLFIPSIKQFSDLDEKYGCRKYPYNPQFRPCLSHKDKIQMKERDKEMDILLSLCVKCWTLDKRTDGSIGETMLMWKTYSSNDIVCRIKTTIRDLADSIKLPCDIIIADMNYGKNDKLSTHEQLLFNKSIHYDQEQEIRMLCMVSKKSGIKIDIQPENLIKEIIISPFIPPQTASFVIAQLRKICSNIEIKLSSIREYNDHLSTNNDLNKVWC